VHGCGSSGSTTSLGLAIRQGAAAPCRRCFSMHLSNVCQLLCHHRACMPTDIGWPRGRRLRWHREGRRARCRARSTSCHLPNRSVTPSGGPPRSSRTPPHGRGPGDTPCRQGPGGPGTGGAPPVCPRGGRTRRPCGEPPSPRCSWRGVRRPRPTPSGRRSRSSSSLPPRRSGGDCRCTSKSIWSLK